MKYQSSSPLLLLILSSTLSSHCTAFTTTSSTLTQKSRIVGASSILNSSINGNDINAHDEECDVLVLGSGPAARAIATLLSSPTTTNQNLNVILSDSNYDRDWAPNYGVWEDEWQSIVSRYETEFSRSIEENCINRKWKVTDCYFGGSFDIPTEQRFRIERPYYRVDKNSLKDTLSPPLEGGNDSWYKVLKANHVSQAMSLNLYSPTGSIVHDEHGSTIKLQTKSEETISVRSKLIIDCTGHETKLVLKEGRDNSQPAGFQIAYGAMVTVDQSDVSDLTQIGPYDKEAMTLFDYRSDHYDGNESALNKIEKAPTFMYAMPMKENQIFFEETSLVARPALSFQECKDRCFKRLEHLGIKVGDIEEEEFCYIPMGGPLPAKDQRIVAFGGAAAIVHPSTGYNLCRTMMSACDVAKVIRKEFASPSITTDSVNLDKVAASAYHAMWSPSNISQRNFAVFGGEFLMKQNVEGLRGFFDGFFRLPVEMWGGFLAGWPGLPNNVKHESWDARLLFGLSFVAKLPLPVAVDMFLSIVTYSLRQGLPLLQSVTPLFGEPESYEYVERPKNQGDVAAKNEARKMIEESKVEEVVPVAFDSKESLIET